MLIAIGIAAVYLGLTILVLQFARDYTAPRT